MLLEKFEFLQEEQNLDHTLKILNEEILNYIQKHILVIMYLEKLNYSDIEKQLEQ